MPPEARSPTLEGIRSWEETLVTEAEDEGLRPGLRDDDGDGEPGGKPSLDGLAGLASPMWLARARARFEKKFYAEGI